jgi:hypothetical protein
MLRNNSLRETPRQQVFPEATAFPITMVGEL